MKYLLLTLLLAACSHQQQKAPDPVPAKDYPKLEDCARLTWCWDNLVLSHITPAMLAANVSSFCPKYKELDGKRVWLNIVKSIAWNESSWNPQETYTESAMGTDPVTKKQVESEGLLQLSYQDAKNWSSLPQCKQIDYGKRNIRDPEINLSCGMAIMDRLAGRNPSKDISNRLKKTGYSSLGDYWSSVWIGKTKSRGMMKKLMPECGL